MATLPLAGTLPRDANGYSIQFPTDFTCTDATTSPQTSPQTGSAVTLVAPAKAYAVVVRATGDFKYGNTASYTGGYTLATGGVDTYIPVCANGTIYLVPVSGSQTFYFAFALTA